eukprot:3400478-Alexandrium_andersonii.AAC.1
MVSLQSWCAVLAFPMLSTRLLDFREMLLCQTFHWPFAHLPPLRKLTCQQVESRAIGHKVLGRIPNPP